MAAQPVPLVKRDEHLVGKDDGKPVEPCSTTWGFNGRMKAKPETDTRAEAKFLGSGFATTRPPNSIGEHYGVYRG